MRLWKVVKAGREIAKGFADRTQAYGWVEENLGWSEFECHKLGYRVVADDR